MANLFISWSGPRAEKMAEILREWIPQVIQAVEPWLSGSDIDKGARWNEELGKELDKARLGIFCLTPENLESPWLNFEAGAISKTVERSYVWTYLLDLQSTDVPYPLAQFNHTRAEKEETRKLMITINKALGYPIKSERALDKAFDTFWPELQEQLAAIPKPAEPAKGETTELIVQNTATGTSYLADRNGYLHPISDQETLLYFAEILGYQPDKLPTIPPGEGRSFGPEVISPRKWRPPKTPEEEFESEVSWNLQYLGKEPRLQDAKTVFTFTFRNDNDLELLVHSARLLFIHGAPLGTGDISPKSKPNNRGLLQANLLFDDGNESGSMLPGKEFSLNLMLTRRLPEKDERAIHGLTIGFIELDATYSGKSVSIHIPQV